MEKINAWDITINIRYQNHFPMHIVRNLPSEARSLSISKSLEFLETQLLICHSMGFLGIFIIVKYIFLQCSRKIQHTLIINTF